MKNKEVIIGTIICLVPMIFGIINYDLMPELMAIHFDAQFKPDSLVNKNIVIFIMPLVFAIVNILLIKMHYTDRKNNEQSHKVKLLISLMIPLISILCSMLTYGYHLGFSLAMVGNIFMGLMFIVIGNYFPKLKRNYFLGIKVPWTLDNEQNWDKTHRLAGYLWVVGGIIFMIIGFYKPFSVFHFIFLLIIVLVPIVYSYLLSRKGF